MASCNSWQYLVTILAKIFPRSWQDLAKILLRYPWRVDPGTHGTLVTIMAYIWKACEDHGKMAGSWEDHGKIMAGS